MLLMQHHQEMLKRRFLVIGIPKVWWTPLIREMTKWEIHSGVEWTIKRLKGLKVDLIRMRNNDQPLTWIRRNSRGEIAGPFGSLIRWSLQNDHNFRRGVQALMAYTFYILPGLSEGQERKFLSAIKADPADGLDPAFRGSFRRFVRRVVGVHGITTIGQPLVTYAGSPGKKAPRLFEKPSVVQGQRILDDLEIFNTTGGMNLYCKYSDLYRPLLRGIGDRLTYLDAMAKRMATGHRLPIHEPVLGGEIHFIQEPGGKLRSVASPYRIHQEALRPLGKLLYDLVKDSPWDCTFDHSKALSHIQSHLSLGGRVHSVDLSSATDLFPLTIQMDVLRTVIPKRQSMHVDLFEEISRSDWKSKLGLLQWTKGQPLGLYPSFAAFTLTHGLLLLYLNGGRHANQFFVLGDDVVILSDELEKNYIAMLDRMRCPWSKEKSLASNDLCEFAGKLITSKWVIPQLKWRQVSDDNFLDLCKLLGPRSRCLLSERQRAAFDWCAHLCEPIGLNFSLPGDNLEKMILRTLQAYHPEEVVLASLMDLRSRIHRHVYPTQESLNSTELNSISATFDEKVRLALSKTVFSRWESSISIGLEGLETVPAALDSQSMLPLKEHQPTRLTTLQRYLRLMDR